MFRPIPLNLPAYAFRLRESSGGLYIFDQLRKRLLLLTPEEWVRQHWIHYLISCKGYPKGLIRTEAGFVLNSLQKRHDLLVTDTSGAPILLAEFKAPGVKITQAAFEQIARYNMVHKVPLLLVSNGLQHYYCSIDFEQQSFTFLKELPVYQK